MTDDTYARQTMQRERIAAQEAIARERMRTQETIADNRSNRSAALLEQRLEHQRQTKQMDLAARTDAARVTGQFDIDLARLQHELLPERLAVEHEFAALASELVKDELLHEAGVRALFSVAEFGAKAKISGKFERERDERQFAHAVELEKMRQNAGPNRETEPEPSRREFDRWYNSIIEETSK